MPTFSRALSLIAGLMLSSIITTAHGQAQLPDFGNAGDRLITPENERKIGEQALQQFRAYELVLDDPVISNYLSSLAFRLVENSESPQTGFKFFLLYDQRVNAFAMPGGFIGVNAGLILTSENESELAGVLAHEIAHVTQRHLVRKVDSARRAILPIALAMAAALALGSGQSDAAPAALMSGISLMQQSQINFTRQHEHEADRIGIKTLARSGFDPMAMATFFEKMERLSRNFGQSPPEFLRTHPVSAVRVAEARSRARNLKPAENDRPSAYEIIKERVRVMSNPEVAHSVDFYVLQSRAASPISKKARLYGSALAASHSGKNEKALELLREALRDDKNDYYLVLALAEVYAADGRLDASLATLNSLGARYPGNYAIEIIRVETLLQSDRRSHWRKARTAIRKQVSKYPREPGLYQILARSENLLNNHTGAIEATAESYFLGGRKQEAIRLLRALLKKEELNYYESSRVTARSDFFYDQLSKKEKKAFDKGEKGHKKDKGHDDSHATLAVL